MNEIEELKKEIEEIKKRNKSVELDKDWETSLTRRILIAIFTYLAISLYMWAIAIDRPFLNAIVPTVGFMLSTLTLPWFKKIWSKKY
jgi:uncharacterized RDD family membrane protein YckC